MLVDLIVCRSEETAKAGRRRAKDRVLGQALSGEVAEGKPGSFLFSIAEG